MSGIENQETGGYRNNLGGGWQDGSDLYKGSNGEKIKNKT